MNIKKKIRETAIFSTLKKIKNVISKENSAKKLSKKIICIKKRMQSEDKTKNPIRVVFIMQYPEMWNSECSVYNFMKKDLRFDVSVLAIPKRNGVNYKDMPFFERNEAYEYCLKNNIEVVDAITPQKTWIDLKKLNIDYIFLQRPYNSDLPKEFDFDKLSRKALLCYIPYGYEFVSGVHLGIEYNDILLKNLYLAFADNNVTYEYVSEVSNRSLQMGARQVFDEGYPRFDLIGQYAMKVKERKTVLWVPRWSLSEHNDKTSFFDYLDLLLEYFNKNSNYDLIIRPHPLMFTNFIEKKIMTKDEVENLKKRIADMDNVSFDTNVNYLNTFCSADILLADFTSLIIEFFALKKPIIYCGETSSFNAIGKIMDQGLYHGQSWDEISAILTDLLKGIDYKKEQYSDIADKIADASGNVGCKIANIIYKDATGIK